MTRIDLTLSDDPGARLRRADELFKAGDYHSSKELFESLHDGTDASIEACLGYIYSIKNSTDYNRDLAIGYFKAAAAKGDVYSLHTLGGLYAENEEWDEAVKWYRVASNLGDAACSYNLYRILTTKPDAVAAGEALHKAADQGHPVARQQLAIKYIIGKYGLKRIPIGLLMYVSNVGALWRYAKEQSAQGQIRAARQMRVVSFEEFSDLIRTVTGARRPISRDTDIAGDLGVAGMDGDRLAAALFETYGFKFTDDEFDRYFGPEQAMTPWHLVLWLLGRGPRLQPLSVGELFDRISDSQGR